MQISANTSVKTIEGHYTCHTKSVITKPQNVLVLRDIMCSGYVAGGNTRWFGEQTAKGAVDGKITTEGIRNAITDRLSFVDDASGEYESMLAFAVPYGHGDRRDQVYSLSARLLPWEVTKDQANWYDYFPGGREHQIIYARAFGLEQLHFGEDVRAAENMEFISSGSVNNATCFLGPHRCYSQYEVVLRTRIPQSQSRSLALPYSLRFVCLLTGGRRHFTNSHPARGTDDSRRLTRPSRVCAFLDVPPCAPVPVLTPRARFAALPPPATNCCLDASQPLWAGRSARRRALAPRRGRQPRGQPELNGQSIADARRRRPAPL